MGPKTQPLGNPRHVSGWVQQLSLCSQAERGGRAQGKTPHLPPCPGGCTNAGHLAFNCGGNVTGQRTWPRLTGKENARHPRE